MFILSPRPKAVLLYVLVCTICISYSSFAQEPNSKFGQIKAKDFEPVSYAVDTAAAAVILYDKGRTVIEGNNKGWFSLKFYHLKRIHILKKSGYDAADIEIQLYRNDDGLDEELQGLKAITYNLENGKVVETKLDRKAIFTDKKSKNISVKKFTLPNVKEGSILEIEYNFKSDFIFNFQPWTFQGAYPRLWSEYSANIPAFLGYITLAQGYHPFHINENSSRFQNYTVLDRSLGVRQDPAVVESNVTEYRWVLKDVPALKTESYTSTLNNHISKIEFQLSEFRPPLNYRKIMGTWDQMTKTLLEDEDFALTVKRDNAWLKETVNKLMADAPTDMDKARAIYEYVRNNMTCTGYSAIYLTKPLRTVFNEKNGNIAEINLLLAAMFDRAGFAVDPVLLSSRSHGFTYQMYPIIEKFNQVICRIMVNDEYYFLDASRPLLGFGRLAADSYNGHARVINAEATAIDLNPDSLKENSFTIVNLTCDTDGAIIGSVRHSPGFYESLSIRDNIKESGTAAVFDNIKKRFQTEVSLKNEYIDSLKILDIPLSLKYDIRFDNADEDILYINPMLTEGWKNNPFESAIRFYPVEMPYTVNETYMLNFVIPPGYEIDELPQQAVVRLNPENEGSFEYRLSHSNGILSLRSSLRLTRSYYLPEEYETLRDFFNLIVKKHSEQIVLKRKARP